VAFNSWIYVHFKTRVWEYVLPKTSVSFHFWWRIIISLRYFFLKDCSSKVNHRNSNVVRPVEWHLESGVGSLLFWNSIVFFGFPHGSFDILLCSQFWPSIPGFKKELFSNVLNHYMKTEYWQYSIFLTLHQEHHYFQIREKCCEKQHLTDGA